MKALDRVRELTNKAHAGDIRAQHQLDEAAFALMPVLLDIAERAEELKLWEPGRAGYAAAQRSLFDALAVLEREAENL